MSAGGNRVRRRAQRGRRAITASHYVSLHVKAADAGSPCGNAVSDQFCLRGGRQTAMGGECGECGRRVSLLTGTVALRIRPWRGDGCDGAGTRSPSQSSARLDGLVWTGG